MVFDADALNTLAALEPSEWPKRRNWGNIVLTPHMGEFMRLMSAVMKRGANVSLAPDPSKPAPVAEVETVPAKKARSLVDDDDDAPSTADGMILDMPEEPPTPSVQDAALKAPEAAQPDRTPLAELLARGTGAVVVLKGHRTVITDGNRVAINTTGNPSMATPGSGDALSGVIASLIGQRLSPLDAATLGVHLHGHAGDLARNAFGANAAGLVATDIIDQLPRAIAAKTV
jgi:NAD(P)H-hydrate repair Nnr-like enzyme with NAD(P)H-hydrate dehydratase domain